MEDALRNRFAPFFLEHIPLRLNQSERQEYAQAFEFRAISFRSNDSLRPEIALEHIPNRLGQSIRQEDASTP
jgi:hypothetical protein